MKAKISFMTIILLMGFSSWGWTLTTEKGGTTTALDTLISPPEQEIKIFGEYRVEKGEVVNDNVSVIGGDVYIAGTTKGNISVYGGDVEIASIARVEGNIRCLGGKINRAEEAEVMGRLVEANLGGITIKPRKKEGTKIKKPKIKFPEEKYGLEIGDLSTIRFNRVEGLYLQGGDKWKSPPPVNVLFYGYGGYGFSMEEWRYLLGLERYWFQRSQLKAGISVYRETATPDEWIIPADENSLAAFFLKEDFHDFYRREGVSVSLSQRLFGRLKLGAQYRQDEHDSLRKNTNWSLFGGHKVFRENFSTVGDSITEGTMKSLFFLGRLGIAGEGNWRLLIYGEYEFAKKSMGGDFNFDRILLDLRLHQPVSVGEMISLRLRAGSASGILPNQKAFYLGYIGSLRGYEYKEFWGDRMVLGNLEYRIGMDFTPGDINLILFGDSGLAWNAGPDERNDWTKSFDRLKWNRLKSDLGIAVCDEDDEHRLNIAKRLDRGEDAWVISFRINRMF
ncbi:BamA/TamA family outer membrane protein [candidate division KSB1 bacterium]|nr:BamA/TamA family outer membrane protein [candidate division KSB1 bacterium]